MSLTPSTMRELGTPMPAFTLPDPRTGEPVSSVDLHGENGLLVAFICNHCPFVIHLKDHLASLHKWAEAADVGMVAISSNDVTTHPQDSPEKMAKLARSEGWEFPYLFDETQSVASAFGAACTPDFFLFDGQSELYYRGQFDDSRPNSDVPVTGDDLRTALKRLNAGSAPPPNQQPSVGCNIKWK